MMVRHVERIPEPELVHIRRSASEFRASLAYDAAFAPPTPNGHNTVSPTTDTA